jgi:hypothetical protein
MVCGPEDPVGRERPFWRSEYTAQGDPVPLAPVRIPPKGPALELATAPIIIFVQGV